MDPNEALEIIYEKKIIIKKKKIKSKETDGRGGERPDRERKMIFIFIFFFLFLSQIYGNRTVDFCWSRRQSWYTRRELCIGTNILAFCQTSKGKKFFHLYYFEPKGYVMD